MKEHRLHGMRGSSRSNFFIVIIVFVFVIID